MNADANYSINPWMQNVPEKPVGGRNSYEDMVMQAALNPVMGETADSIRQRTPGLNIQAFPDRFGYRQEALGIADMAQVDNLYERVDFTGRNSGYSGTSYPSLNQF